MADERSANDIQQDIEQSRVALAAAVDQLAYRGNPKRVLDKTKQAIRSKAESPAGRAAIAVAGTLVVVLIIRRVRKS